MRRRGGSRPSRPLPRHGRRERRSEPAAKGLYWVGAKETLIIWVDRPISSVGSPVGGASGAGRPLAPGALRTDRCQRPPRLCEQDEVHEHESDAELVAVLPGPSVARPPRPKEVLDDAGGWPHPKSGLSAHRTACGRQWAREGTQAMAHLRQRRSLPSRRQYHYRYGGHVPAGMRT